MRRPSQSKRQALAQRLPSKPSTETAELVFARTFFRSIPLGAPCASKRWRSTNRRAHCVPTTSTQQTCSAKGVVSEAYNEAFPGCTSDWSKVGNLIDSKDAAAQVGANSNMQNRTVFPHQEGIKGPPPSGGLVQPRPQSTAQPSNTGPEGPKYAVGGLVGLCRRSWRSPGLTCRRHGPPRPCCR